MAGRRAVRTRGGPAHAHNVLRAYACNKLLRRSRLPSAMFDVGRAYEDFRPFLRLLLGTPGWRSCRCRCATTR
ncbi:hypothetical protein BJF78_28650 [Pseudonocardia sp. CNS-139]|nr:hypothetical protein BJF78_28650 [Pseudonocardia sp. CNS-139]